jgi:uncharacterized protein (DUF1778 family)
MPIMTTRMTEEEIEAIDRAAERARMTRSEFVRRSVSAAVEKIDSVRGLKGKFSYKQAMKLVRG